MLTATQCRVDSQTWCGGGGHQKLAHHPIVPTTATDDSGGVQPNLRAAHHMLDSQNCNGGADPNHIRVRQNSLTSVYYRN